MRKGTLTTGIVLLALCLALHSSAASQSNEPAEFIKLLDEAENYFLDEDYNRAKMALDKTQKILEQQIKPSQETERFFDLSAPENTVRSFVTSTFFHDEKRSKACWSKRTPKSLVSLIMAMMEEFRRQAFKDVPELANPEMLELMLLTIRYEKERTGQNSYYVWVVPPGGERNKDMQCKVIRENGGWKILTMKVWEEEGVLTGDD